MLCFPVSDRLMSPSTSPEFLSPGRDALRVVEVGWNPIMDEVSSISYQFLNIGFAVPGGQGWRGAITGLKIFAKRIFRGDYDLLVTRSLDRFIYRSDRSVFINLGRWMVRRILFRLIWRAGRSGKMVVLVDMTDEPTLDALDAKLIPFCDACFKRELPVNTANLLQRCPPRFQEPIKKAGSERTREILSRVYPISIGPRQSMLVERLEQQERFARPVKQSMKRYDLIWAGAAEGSPVREHAKSLLGKLAQRGVEVLELRERIDRQEFWDLLSQSWLTLSPEGLGWDCIRHYEACLVQSVPVINQPTIRRYRPLEEGRHAFFYQPYDHDLIRVVTSALEDKAALLAMAREAREFVLRHHVQAARGRYIIETACLSRNCSM